MNLFSRYFRQGLLAFFGLSLLILQGCMAGPGTALTVAGLGGHEVAQRFDDMGAREKAAMSVEEDLLTFSVEAIARGRTKKAEAKYLATYENTRNADPIRALSLYQVGLMYMNIYNVDRNDDLAEHYLLKAKSEFDIALLTEHVDKRLAILEDRKDEVVIQSASHYLAEWRARPKETQSTNSHINTHDNDMNEMTARAITNGQIDEARYLYLSMYNNEGTSRKLRSESLYQIGLIYLSPYNPTADKTEAEKYFKKVMEEFPGSAAAKKSMRKMSRL